MAISKKKAGLKALYLLEKVAVTFQQYKKEHPNTKKTPTDNMFEHARGRTRSGKRIDHESWKPENHKGWTKHDHDDAYLHHNALSLKYFDIGKKYPEHSKERDHANMKMRYHHQAAKVHYGLFDKKRAPKQLKKDKEHMKHLDENRIGNPYYKK